MVTYSSAVYSYSSHPWIRELPLHSGLPWQFPALTASLPSPFIVVKDEQLYASFPQLILPETYPLWEHRITYCSHRSPGRRPGELGPGWFLADLPFLVYGHSSFSQRPQITVVGSLACKATFQKDDAGGWTTLDDPSLILEHDIVDRSFSFTASGLMVISFYSFDPSLPRQLRGKFKAAQSLVEDASAHAVYGSHAFPDKVTFFHQNTSDIIIYEPDTKCFHDQLGTVTHFCQGTPVKRIRYQYANKPWGISLLKGINTELRADDHWIIEKRVLLKYAKNTVQLREVKIWDISFKISNICTEGGDQFQLMGHYEIHSDLLDDILWIRHTGQGPEPLFYD